MEQGGRQPQARVRVERQKRQEIKTGQGHAGDPELYFLGNKKPIADWLMEVINFRSPRCVGTRQYYWSSAITESHLDCGPWCHFSLH